MVVSCLLSLVLSCLLSLSRGQWEGAACLSRGADKAATVGWRLTCVKAVRALTAMTDYRFVCLSVCLCVSFQISPCPICIGIYLHRYLRLCLSPFLLCFTPVLPFLPSLPFLPFLLLVSLSATSYIPPPHHVQRHALFQLPNNNSIPTHIYIYNF